MSQQGEGENDGQEHETWSFHINVLGPNSAGVGRIFAGLVRAVPGLAFQLAAQQPPAAQHPPAPLVVPPTYQPSPGYPTGTPTQKRRVGRPSKAETRAREAALRAAAGYRQADLQAAAAPWPTTSTHFQGLMCQICSSPNANRTLVCGHFACETCIIPFLNLHGVCPECSVPCKPNDLKPARP